MDDDYVIFENSPLHQYLSVSGCQSETQIRNSPGKQKSNKISSGFFSKYLGSGLFDQHLLSFQFIKNRLHHNFNCTKNYYDNKLIDVLLDSNLLEEDDRNFFMNCFKVKKLSEEKINKLVFNKYYMICIHGVLLASVVGLYSSSYVDSLLFSFLKLFTFGLTLLYSLFFFVEYRTRSLWQNRLRNFQSFIEVQFYLDSNLKKVLKLIHEREILARGFTSVTKFTPTIRNVESEEPTTTLSLPLLSTRKTLHKVISSLFSDIKAKTLMLNDDKTLDTEDFPEDHFVFAKLDEIDLFGTNNQKNDMLTVSALKMYCQYFSLQRSEFLRFWILVLCSFSSSLASKQLFVETEYDKLLKDFVDVSKGNLELLELVLDSYSPQHLFELCSNKKKATSFASNEVATLTESLRLHLQVSLEEVLRVADLGSAMEESDVDNLHKVLNKIDSNLNASVACAVNLREVIQRSHKKIQDDVPVVRFEQTSQNQTNVRIVDDLYEPIIKDEVFEAIVSKLDGLENNAVVDDDRLNFEKYTLPRGNLLSELKSVLNVRSTAMREREMRALAARRDVSIEDLIKEEEENLLMEENGECNERSAKSKRKLLPSSDDFVDEQLSSSVVYRGLTQAVNDAEDVDAIGSPLSINLADELKQAFLGRGVANIEEYICDDDDADD